jgi:electron transfer flavoprotein beta subunit
MKIAVAYKWAADPAEASVDSAGRIDYSRAKPGISEYDCVAIQAARDLADSASAELIGISVGPAPPAGPAAPLAAKAALSRGLDSLTVVVDESAASADASRTGQALAAAIRQIGALDLVIMGDCSIDQGAGLVPGVTAGQLGWPAVLESGRVVAEEGRILVKRDLAGSFEHIELTGPAVIGVAAGAAQPKAPGMKDVLSAAKKPVTQLSAAALGVGPPQGQVVATAKLDGPARLQIAIDTADPAQAAASLIDALKAAGLTLGGAK